jgi:hypothetical protein
MFFHLSSLSLEEILVMGFQAEENFLQVFFQMSIEDIESFKMMYKLSKASFKIPGSLETFINLSDL